MMGLRKRHWLRLVLVSWLLGILLASFAIDYVLSIQAVVGGGLFLLGGLGVLGVLLTGGVRVGAAAGGVAVFGAIYLFGYQQLHESPLPTGDQIIGRVDSLVELRGTTTRFILRSQEGARLLVTTQERPDLFYGDLATLEGEAKQPERFEDFAYRGATRVFDYDRYLAARSIDGVVSFARLIERQGVDRSVWIQFRRSLFTLRTGFVSALVRAVPEPEAGMLRGMIVGDKHGVDPQVSETLRQAGVVHILVVSGYNVAIILSGLMNGLTRWLYRRTSFVVTAAVAVAFFLITGGEAPIARATIFGLLVAGGTIVGRQTQPTLLFLWAAALMSLHNPLIVRFDLSFGLSVLATFGLIAVSPLLQPEHPWRVRCQRLPGVLYETLITTLGAQLLVTPLLVYHFGSLSVVSLLVNVLVLPTVPLAMGFGIVSGGLGLFGGLGGLAARTIGLVAWLPLRYLRGVAEVATTLVPWQLALPFNRVLLIAAYLLIALAVLYVRRQAEVYAEK